MKTQLFVIILLLTTIHIAEAQFKSQITLGYSSATGDLGKGASAGFGIGANARYIFSDRLDAGLSLERDVITADGQGDFGITAITAKGFYKILDSKIQPYVAFALGVYILDIPTTPNFNNKSTGFGFSPEAGIYLGKFDVGVQYTSAGDLPGTDTEATYLKYHIGYTFSFGG